MCRICYIPEVIEGVNYVKMFNELEKIDGGHGNGIGGFVNHKSLVVKGVKCANKKLFNIIQQNQWDSGTLYHTRWASYGSICDYNVHPFEYYGAITCHNGTWGAANIAKMMLMLTKQGPKKDNMFKMNDSRTIAYLIGKFGFETASLIDNGVIVTLYPNSCLAKINGDFMYARYGKRCIYASSFPEFIEEEADEVRTFRRGSIARLTQTGPKFFSGGFEKNKISTVYCGYNVEKGWLEYGDPY